jgi:hypothetical protein
VVIDEGQQFMLLAGQHDGNSQTAPDFVVSADMAEQTGN